MCDLNQPRSASGPALCEPAKELIVRRILEGDKNAQIRTALKKDGHIHDLSEQTFCNYRKLEVVREARIRALASIKDVGVVSLSRRVERLNDAAEMLLTKSRSASDNKERAALVRTAVHVCRELSRLVDLVDPDGTDGIPNGVPEEEAPREITVEQVLRVIRTLTVKKRQLAAASMPHSEAVP